jgi:hypothetical protein
MIDQSGFRARNVLEAPPDPLVRISLLAICLTLAGAVIQAWMSRESQRELVLGAGILDTLVFIVGAVALWHANAIERAGRPPFVL